MMQQQQIAAANPGPRPSLARSATLTACMSPRTDLAQHQPQPHQQTRQPNLQKREKAWDRLWSMDYRFESGSGGTGGDGSN